MEMNERVQLHQTNKQASKQTNSEIECCRKMVVAKAIHTIQKRTPIYDIKPNYTPYNNIQTHTYARTHQPITQLNTHRENSIYAMLYCHVHYYYQKYDRDSKTSDPN